jgi:hypothetical protein
MLPERAKQFFHHSTLEFAVSQGFSLDGDLAEFYADKDLTQFVVYDLFAADKVLKLTEQDVYSASLGQVTEGFKSFFKELKYDGKDSTPILVSMHSGSSDYYTVSTHKQVLLAL